MVTENITTIEDYTAGNATTSCDGKHIIIITPLIVIASVITSNNHPMWKGLIIVVVFFFFGIIIILFYGHGNLHRWCRHGECAANAFPIVSRAAAS